MIKTPKIDRLVIKLIKTGGHLLTTIKTCMVRGAHRYNSGTNDRGINNCILIGHKASFTGENTCQQLELTTHWEIT